MHARFVSDAVLFVTLHALSALAIEPAATDARLTETHGDSTGTLDV